MIIDNVNTDDNADTYLLRCLRLMTLNSRREAIGMACSNAVPIYRDRVVPSVRSGPVSPRGKTSLGFFAAGSETNKISLQKKKGSAKTMHGKYKSTKPLLQASRLSCGQGCKPNAAGEVDPPSVLCYVMLHYAISYKMV